MDDQTEVETQRIPEEEVLDDGEVPEYLRKSQKTRRVLIAVIVALLALAAAFAFFAANWIGETQTAAVQQAQQQAGEQGVVVSKNEAEPDDSVDAPKKVVDIPPLSSLMGLTQKKAVAKLGHGASVTGTRKVKEKGNPITKSAAVALTDDPADSKSGTPTVYLFMNKKGKVIQAGYSVPLASLGYGPESFVSAVRDKHVIENSLKEAGLTVSEKPSLPEDKKAYSEYASDGYTLARESYTFKGTGKIKSKKAPWSASLVYDYAMANRSGNLADTVRLLHITIG